MNKEPIVKAVILYNDFKRLSEKQKESILNNDCEQIEFLISIKNEIYENLSAEEKKELEGFKRTEVTPLKVEVVMPEKLFELPPRIEIEEISKPFKEKHRKYLKPRCPKNIINRNFNTKKKGGR